MTTTLHAYTSSARAECVYAVVHVHRTSCTHTNTQEHTRMPDTENDRDSQAIRMQWEETTQCYAVKYFLCASELRCVKHRQRSGTLVYDTHRYTRNKGIHASKASFFMWMCAYHFCLCMGEVTNFTSSLFVRGYWVWIDWIDHTKYSNESLHTQHVPQQQEMNIKIIYFLC